MQNSTLAKIAITAAVAVTGVGFFVKSTFDHGSRYRLVDKLVGEENLADWADKEIKVHGYVLANSISEQVVNQQTQRTFVLQNNGKKIRVYSSGPKPDTFKDQSEVVATGRLVPVESKKDLAAQLGVVGTGTELAYVLDAKELQAKCPSKYEGAQVNKNLDDKFE
jgi:cytochrome c-type biogenesis protein CcmE